MVGRFLGYEVMKMHSVGCLGGSVVLRGLNIQSIQVGDFWIMYSTYVWLLAPKKQSMKTCVVRYNHSWV